MQASSYINKHAEAKPPNETDERGGAGEEALHHADPHVSYKQRPHFTGVCRPQSAPEPLMGQFCMTDSQLGDFPNREKEKKQTKQQRYNTNTASHCEVVENEEHQVTRTFLYLHEKPNAQYDGFAIISVCR